MYHPQRRNLLLKCIVIFNVFVLLYISLHFTSSSGSDNSAQNVQITYVEADEIYARPLKRNNFSDNAKYFIDDESQTSQKTTTTVNKTVSSTVSLADIEKNIMQQVVSALPSEQDPTDKDFDLDQQDENALSDATLARLKALLDCKNKDFTTVTRQHGDYWALINYVKAEHGSLSCHETMTYTTHAGFEFLDNVLPLVERWMAPVSLSIHTPGTDLQSAVNSIRYLRDCSGSDLIRTYVTFHLFFHYRHTPSKIPQADSFLDTPYNCSLPAPYAVNSSTTFKKQKNLLYPINIARNLAREAALTHFILPSDIELYPSPNLVPRFLNMIARNEKPLNTSTKPRVFPISIFEVSAKVQVPTNKTELQAMLKNKTAVPFHKFVCPMCHNIPQGPQWMKAAETELMDVFHVGKRRGSFLHWEPIFIGTNDEPFYDERLSWEGKQDKMTQGYVLCVKDYDFMILNNAFLTHKPGIKQYRKDAKRDNIARQQNKMIAHVIIPELKRLFGTKAGCAV